jgi:hypothetical protein
MGLRTIFARLRRWFQGGVAPAAAPRDVRLRVERLEARDVPAAAINDAYTASLIQGFLGRAATAADLAFWDARLAGGETRTQVATEIVASPEFQGRELQLLYQTLLGRQLDQTGLNTWGPILRNGGTLDQVKAGILGSLEYFVRNGGTNPAWLTAVYQSQLGRALDQPGEVAFTTQLINGGLSRTQVAAEILASDEANVLKIGGTYRNILSRALDSPGVSFWGAQTHNGLPVESVFFGVVGSDEFLNQLQASLFQTGLGDPNQAANQFLLGGGRFAFQLPGVEVLNRALSTTQSVNTVTLVIPTTTGVATVPTTSVTSTTMTPIVAGVPSSLGVGSSLVTPTTSFTTPGVSSGTPFGAGIGTTVGAGAGATVGSGGRNEFQRGRRLDSRRGGGVDVQRRRRLDGRRGSGVDFQHRGRHPDRRRHRRDPQHGVVLRLKLVLPLAA